MDSIEELYPVFQRLVQLATGVETVILANQTTAPPTGLYATYLPVPVRAYGHVRRERTEVPATEPFDPELGDWTDFDEKALTSMQFILSVNILNEGAATAAMKLHNANFRGPISKFLFENNIAWRYVSDARNLTGLMQAGVQPRYQSDIHLFIEAAVSYPVLRAAGFSVELKFELPDVEAPTIESVEVINGD